ncbi:MAG: hypothetical protein HY900_16030 [Deltaproteobacteria bacterium]|nr:hypothetical protein [Deltaproteobacteria bacterium]
MPQLLSARPLGRRAAGRLGSETSAAPPSPKAQRCLATLLFLATFGVLLLGVCSAGHAAGFAETGHGDRSRGVSRVLGLPKGSCGHCHLEGAGVKFPMGLWRENDNELCYACHRQAQLRGPFPGQEVYESSRHRTDPRTVWPGPYPPSRREPGAAGKCLNCHSPHGKKDRLGTIPSLLVAREEAVCLACHDGDPAVADIAREIRKPYAHPARLSSGKHAAREEANPDRFSYVGGNRHAECADCHNAHAAYPDSGQPLPPRASNRNARVSRVRVLNREAGAVPLYEFLAANDSGTPALEYEICFKCHSSWTQQPPGQDDMARLFNTNNASYHPVEGQARGLTIRPESFVPGMNAASIIYCGDCHGSDDSRVRGPHGSQNANLLRRPYLAQAAPRAVARDELCFLCHRFETYAQPLSSGFDLQASRFNPPATAGGHAFHVGRQGFPCYACHDSHGSPQFPALLRPGRTPGIRSYSQRRDGGTCQATCHATRSYGINYPR